MCSTPWMPHHCRTSTYFCHSLRYNSNNIWVLINYIINYRMEGTNNNISWKINPSRLHLSTLRSKKPYMLICNPFLPRLLIVNTLKALILSQMYKKDWLNHLPLSVTKTIKEKHIEMWYLCSANFCYIKYHVSSPYFNFLLHCRGSAVVLYTHNIKSKL